MENYLMLGTQRIELSRELAEFLLRLSRMQKEPEEHKKDPFARAECSEEYYSISRYGTLGWDWEDGTGRDDRCHRVANYCTDKPMMEQRALHETLNRLLWRYSEQHGGDSEWDGVNRHWCIFNSSGRIAVQAMAYANTFGCVHFAEREIAEAAIKEIVEPFMAEHPEFVW